MKQIFQSGKPEVIARLQVNAKTNVWLQPLLDCVNNPKTSEYLTFTVISVDGDGQTTLVKPRLPIQYEVNNPETYYSDGYLFNLPKGEYAVRMVAYLEGAEYLEEGVVDGRKWMIRAASASKQKGRMSLQIMN